VLKNPAPDIFPLNSNTLILIKVLAHSVFHKMCAEAQAVDKASFAAGAEPVFMVRQGWDYTSPGAFINAPASRPFALPLPIF
jgi:hypothetical protein